MSKPYLHFEAFEFCPDKLKNFYKKFFSGRVGHSDGYNIQIAYTDKLIIIRRVNLNGTSSFFEDFEVAHCYQFALREKEIAMSGYSECVGGVIENWDTKDKMEKEMIDYIKQHHLIFGYIPRQV